MLNWSNGWQWPNLCRLSRRFETARFRLRRRNLQASSVPAIVDVLEPRQLLSAIVVTTVTDNSNDGDTSSITALQAHPGSDGKISLREAILAANNTGGDNSITFDPNLTSHGPITISPIQVGDATSDNSAFAINSTLTIVGASDPSLITLNGTGPTGDLRLFRALAGANLTLQGISMTGWATDTNGAVLAVDPGAAGSLTNCTLNGNRAMNRGGAIFNLSNENSPVGLQLTNCTLSDNQAHDGGAYAGGQTSGGYASFSQCTLTGNSAVDRGGAIALYDSFVSMADCTLAGNSAHQGGGIAGGGITLLRTRFVGNEAIDGGGLFAGIASGASDNGEVQMGAPGGPSDLNLNTCTFIGNTAQHRGGAIFLGMITPTSLIAKSTFTANHAQIGGGLFSDTTESGFFSESGPNGNQLLTVTGSVFSNNSATSIGGAIFTAGALNVSASKLTSNVAHQGAAIYNDLGWVTVRQCNVSDNLSAQGTQLLNHSGIMPMTGSTVSDVSLMTFLPVGTDAKTQYVAPYSGQLPETFIPALGSKLATGPDGINYALTPDQILLHQLPGSSWEILDDLVISFKLAPDGNCYWLNERRELNRSQAGSAGDLIGQDVQSYAMDQHGTVFDLSNGDGPGNYAAYRSLTAPLLDPPDKPVTGSGPMFCTDPPSTDKVLQALGFTGPDFLNVKVVEEPIVDRIDPPRYFPGIGLAQLHHCHYKCTIYYDTPLLENPSLTDVLSATAYIDQDHLHLYNLGQATSTIAAFLSNSSAAVSSVSPNVFGNTVESLWTGPDGTLYKLGGDYNGVHDLGASPAPNLLWKLPPGGHWQPLMFVYSAIVTPNNTLYALNANHELQQLSPHSSQWVTLASYIQNFSRTQNGTLYALNQTGTLFRWAPQAIQPTTFDTGVKSFAFLPDGSLVLLNSQGQLKCLAPDASWSVIDTGVQFFGLGATGSYFELNGRHQLLQLGSHGQLINIANNILNAAVDIDGTLYALSSQNVLNRMTAGGHWSLVDVDVQSFLLAPNALRSVYILSTNHELKRLEAGYFWLTFRTDVKSISMNSLGVVTARDLSNRQWLYWSGFVTPILVPVEGSPPMFCMDPPTKEELLAVVPVSGNVNKISIVDEPTIDQIDAPRWFSNLGQIPAVRVHHCQYRCTITYTNAKGTQTITIEFDHDHLIRSN